MATTFDTKTYDRRKTAETAFSILKRLLGETIYSRSSRQQVKEIVLNVSLLYRSFPQKSEGVLMFFEDFNRATYII